MERDHLGRLVKGHSGLKPKGATHKTSRYTRELLTELLEVELERIHTHLDQLTPAERVEFITKLLPYIVPKPPAEANTEPLEVQGIPLIRFIQPQANEPLEP
jgi:hypothetical protein